MTDNRDKEMDSTGLTVALFRELLAERKSEKRWRNIRYFIGVLIVIGVLMIAFAKKTETVTLDKGNDNYVSLLRLEGMIAPGSSFSAEVVLPYLKEAFADKESKGVMLVIDSGGGTPVQASIIHDAILKYKKTYHKKVVVVGEDLLASGAYYIAVAGDKIYVNPNTITGSIGVIMKGFGFEELIKKIGVERRIIAAGDNKDRLDPFLPETPEDMAKLKGVVGEVHKNFIRIVQEGRQGKLHGDSAELFSGDFWTGESALNLGLVDVLGNLPDALQNEFQVARFKEYGKSDSLLKMLAQMGMSMGMSWVKGPVLVKA